MSGAGEGRGAGLTRPTAVPAVTAGTAWCFLASPLPRGRGAIAVIEVRGEIDGALERTGIKPVAMGEARVRDLGGVDTGVVARWHEDAATVMPHAGPAVVACVLDRMRLAGVAVRHPDGADAELMYPEARSSIEANVLAALARAASPMAVEVLLAQPARWSAAGWMWADRSRIAGEASAGARDRWRRLDRLINPPMVVALGPPNIGKSTLLNALAGRGVSIVADQPGTTRDHVGATLDLGGLVVRYLDTPGMDALPAGPIDAEAQAVSRRMAAGADLVILASDPAAEPVGPPEGVPVLRVGLRADLGRGSWAGGEPEVRVSAPTGDGIERLVEVVRDRLVHPADLASGEPWMFVGAE